MYLSTLGTPADSKSGRGCSCDIGSCSVFMSALLKCLLGYLAIICGTLHLPSLGRVREERLNSAAHEVHLDPL